jgi:hypothetical protein
MTSLNETFDAKRNDTPRRWLAWICLAAAVLATSLAGVRTLTAEDLGYHLAFGEAFWQEGRLVDHCEFIYTLPPASPQAQKPDPGPGCWYDSQGRYRFPNANWLTQVIFYAAWWLGGAGGLNVLLAGCVAGLAVLLAMTCLRAGGGPLAAAAAVLLAAMTVYPRLMLRPELLGYLALLGKTALLAPVLASGDPNTRLSRKAILGVVLLQLLYINLHSYWLLGLALTGATLIAPFAVLLGRPNDADTRRVCGAALRQRGGLLLAQILVCFVNPWTWRLVVLPVQTLVYLREHNIHGLFTGDNPHPWNIMVDMQRLTLLPTEENPDIAAYVFIGVFAALVVSVLVAMFRKRWGVTAVVLGMLLVAFSAQRNLAVAVLTALPFGVATLGEPLRQALRTRQTATRVTGGAMAAVVLLAASAAGVLFTTNTLYRHDRYHFRFGAGYSRRILPVGVANFLNERGPVGRLWAEPQSSSTLYFFTRPHPPIQMITNTWAYPPATMLDVVLATDRGSGEELAERWNVSIVAIPPRTMFKSLREDGNWTLVALVDGHGVFVRNDGPDGELTGDPLEAGDIDTAGLLKQWTGHPDGYHELNTWAELLAHADFLDEAIEIAEAARKLAPPGNTAAARWAFTARWLRARQRLAAGNPNALDDYDRTQELLETFDATEENRQRLAAEKQAAAAKFRHGG